MIADKRRQLSAEISSQRNDGWTEAAMQRELDIIELFDGPTRNPAADHLRDYLIGVEDNVEMVNYLDLALAAEYDRASNEGYHQGIADCKEHDPAAELDRTSERRPLAHLLTADEYQAIRERNAVRQGEVRHGTGSDPVMDRDALIRHIDARAIEAERSAGVATLDVGRLETIVALARRRERAEEAWADALAQRGHAQAIARIGTERAEATLELRRALDEYARLSERIDR